jgi:hemerythrin-like metal-binding protein
MSVQNLEIDNQHKEWLRIMNTLHETILGHDPLAQRTATKTALDAMAEYTSTHFRSEEEYMREIKYTDQVHHRRLHKNFDSLIYKLRRDVQTGRLVLNSDVISLLKNWLIDHIAVEDQKYARFSTETNSSEGSDQLHLNFLDSPRIGLT